MIRRVLALTLLASGAYAGGDARAADCPGNPNALGTSRVLAIEPREFPRLGTMQYAHTLPLADKEVVLTFDDGPLPPYSNRVLDILAQHCVKAHYFLIGRMARGYPAIVRRIQAEGHTVGTHSQNHLLAFDRMPLPAVQREVDDGIASVVAALGRREAVAPFFRIPGLLRSPQVDRHLAARGLATWSADVAGDDWKHVTASEVVRRVMARLAEKGKGIVLLHDIQPATVLALPELLREMKVRGYRVVHVVPAPAQPKIAEPARPPEPAVAEPAPAAMPQPVLAQPEPSNAGAQDAQASDGPAARPFAPGLKPAQNVPTPAKVSRQRFPAPPNLVSVPVPQAGGVGVSALVRSSRTPDGRFQP